MRLCFIKASSVWHRTESAVQQIINMCADKRMYISMYIYSAMSNTPNGAKSNFSEIAHTKHSTATGSHRANANCVAFCSFPKLNQIEAPTISRTPRSLHSSYQCRVIWCERCLVATVKKIELGGPARETRCRLTKWK